MTITRKILTAALAAGLTFGAAGAAFADSPYRTRNFAESAPEGPQKPQRNPNLPHDLKCERGIFAETRCNISPNGRVYGPEAWDYATGTGQHILR